MARTKSQRKAQSRFKGATTNEVSAREPNGQLSRRKAARRARSDMTEQEAKAVMIAARIRHTGLSAELCNTLPETGKANVGTPHGLLYLQGFISHDQWLSAEFYLNKRNEYLQSIKAPGAQFQAGHDASGDEEAYTKWCEAVAETWKEIRRCINEASVQSRSPIAAAFDHILERQGSKLDHMVPDLRIGLNVIHRVFLTAKSRAA